MKRFVIWFCAFLIGLGCAPRVKTVFLTNETMGGSGFVAAPGKIITASHVADNEGLIVVDGPTTRPTTNPVSNAILDTAMIDADVIGSARIRFPRLGEKVRIVGYIPDEFLRPVRIEAIGHVISGPMTRNGAIYYLVQGAAGPGMSGGPVIGEDGFVIGIVLGFDLSPLLIRVGILTPR